MIKFNKDVLNEDRSKFINHMINMHKTKIRGRIEELLSYYEGSHTAIMNKMADDYKPCNRVTNPFPALLIDTLQGYMLGQEVQYTCDNTKMLDYYKAIMTSNEEADINTELLKTMSITGEAIEYIYINDEKEITTVELPILETMVAYDNELKPNILFALRYYTSSDLDNRETTHVEMYTKESILYYKEESKGVYELQEEYKNMLNVVPVVHYRNNKEEKGDFEKILSLINDYDKIISSDSDEIETFANAYLVLNGFGQVDEGTLKLWRKMGAFVVPKGNMNGVSNPVSFAQKGHDTTSVLNHLQVIVDNIHKFSQIPNLVDPKAGTSDSGVAIRQRTWGFEQLGALKERKLKKAFIERMEIISKASSMLSREEIAPSEFNIVFNRNLPSNVKEDAEILSLLGLSGSNLGEEALKSILSAVTIVENAQEAAREVSVNNELLNSQKDVTEAPGENVIKK